MTCTRSSGVVLGLGCDSSGVRVPRPGHRRPQSRMPLPNYSMWVALRASLPTPETPSLVLKCPLPLQVMKDLKL